MIANKDWKAIWTKLWTLIKSITGDVDVKGKGTIQAQLDKKPELDGTNATGDWDINITGKATSATYASTSTKAGTATYATNAGTASYGTKAGTATYATNSGTSSYGTKAGTATYATSAGTADKLKNARTIRTNLASTATASFDGSGNVTPGVTGTLPVANGGTGKTTLEDSANALINGLSLGSSTPEDSDYYVAQYAGGGTTTTTFHRRPVSALWEYMKGKISSVLGLTASSYSGNAKTATSATTATKAGTATYATNAGTATYAKNAGTSNYSSNGAKATSATSATYATTATKAGTATYASNIANNLTTTGSGYALDARQGKALNDAKLSKSWNFLIATRANTLVDLSSLSSGTEILVRVSYSIDTVEHVVTKRLIKDIDFFDSKTYYFTEGSYANALFNSFCGIYIDTKCNIKCDAYCINGTEYLTSSNMAIYYR